jgi:HK97 family phage prohead protease
MHNQRFEKPSGVEYRTGTLRNDSQGDEMALVATATSYNVLSSNLGGFREKIAPSAFTRSLANDADVKCLLNHSANHILGRTKSGTLKVWSDSIGLHYRCQLDRNQQMHRDLHAAIRRGDISECSFSFSIPDGGDSWEETDGADNIYAIRTVRDCDLLDVSPVVYPAYAAAGATSVAARHAGAVSDAQRRARANAIGEMIRADRIAQAGKDAAEDLAWLARMAQFKQQFG